MPNTYVALRTETLATAASSVTLSLSGISGYTDLVLVSSVQKTTSGSGSGFNIRFNGDTGTNYSNTYLEGSGSSASSYRSSNSTGLNGGALTSSAVSTQFDANINHIMNYSNSTTFKTVLGRYNDNEFSYVGAVASLWRNTAAITSITLYSANTFAVGSTFSLYGIANADQGAAKATGGIITEDSQYWYHTFGASGVFTPKVALTCDYLVVAGGAGGGTQHGGGGGAGGLRSTVTATGGGGSLESPLSLIANTQYTVTVGGGGPGSPSGTDGTRPAGTNGSNSVFATITSTGGGGGMSYRSAGSNPGIDGGSGGGGGSNNTGSNSAGGNGTTNQGYAGSAGSYDLGGTFVGGGGGGAGSAGVAYNLGSKLPGNGGSGVATSISGLSFTYAGGGGGGNYAGAGGIGGTGGGGNGAATSANGSAGTVNTGGGGGAGSRFGNTGGAGGSGIVIVRYSK